MLLAALLLLAAGPAVLSARPAAAAEAGWLRIAHLSPDTPPVDVTVAPVGSSGDPVTERGVGYGTVSAWHRLAPGAYAVAVRRAGAAATTAPVLSIRVDLGEGSARTVAATGRFADLRLDIADDDLSAPPPGRARVSVVDAASQGPLDVSLAGGPALAAGLQPADRSGPVDVPDGAATLEVAAAGAAPVAVPVELAPVTTLLVLDRPGGGLSVRAVADAGGPSGVPVGPVQAGAGGTAGGDSLGLPGAVLCGLAGTLLLGTFRPGRRTPAGRRTALARTALAVMAAAGAVLALAAPAAAPAARVDPPVRVPGPIVVVGPAAATTAAPVRVQLPGVDAPIVPVALDATGALLPPSDVATAGWFAGGPAPGDIGPAVLAGHVDSLDQPGAFFPLRSVVAGDEVTVTRADGSAVRFVVTRVARFAKSGFPSAEVYGPTPDAELRLVTCGGRFDRASRSYEDDVVVFAREG